MNLEQYVTDLCAKLRSNEVVMIDVDCMPYRHLIASVLQNNLAGPASPVVEGLLNQVVGMQDNFSRLKHDNDGLVAKLEAVSLEELKKRGREIQSAPKKGNISKKKIESAVKAVQVKANKDAV